MDSKNISGLARNHAERHAELRTTCIAWFRVKFRVVQRFLGIFIFFKSLKLKRAFFFSQNLNFFLGGF